MNDCALQRACENLEDAIARRSYNRQCRLRAGASVNTHNYSGKDGGGEFNSGTSTTDGAIGGKPVTESGQFNIRGGNLNGPLVGKINEVASDLHASTSESARDMEVLEGHQWRDTDDDFLPEEEPREWLFCTRVPGCDGGSNGAGFNFDAESADAIVGSLKRYMIEVLKSVFYLLPK